MVISGISYNSSYLYSYNNLAYGLDTKTGSKSQAYELKCDEIKYETYIIWFLCEKKVDERESCG